MHTELCLCLVILCLTVTKDLAGTQLIFENHFTGFEEILNNCENNGMKRRES